MPRKIAGYFLLSFLSFCFFSGLFLTLAHSKASADQSSQQVLPTLPPPTPTLYVRQNPPRQEIKQGVLLLPTPTIYIAPKQEVLAASTKVHDPQPTISLATPTPQPTAMPTPTATPIPQAIITNSTDLETLFSTYSSQYNVSEDLLKKIASCESGFTSTSDTGVYAGMFQFSSGTWESIRGVMGLDGNPDLRKNPEEAIRTAAYMLSRGEQNAWPNCH